MNQHQLGQLLNLIKLAQAMPPMPPAPPQGMPPQGGMPMDPAMMQGGGMPMDPAMAQGGMPMDPAMMQGGMPPAPPQLDPLLQQLLMVFGQLPPGAFTQLIEMPTEQLTELAKVGQIPPEAAHLLLYLRQAGSLQGMGEDTVTKESRVREWAKQLINQL